MMLCEIAHRQKERKKKMEIPLNKAEITSDAGLSPLSNDHRGTFILVRLLHFCLLIASN